jgi:hypothetical protein
MRRTLRSVLWSSASCLLLFAMTSCLGENRIIANQDSPGGKYVAELGEGDTGAVGGWMSSVQLYELSPSQWTRLFRRDRKTVFGGDFRSTHVTFRWKTEGELEITCNKCDRSKIDVQESGWKGIRVSYVMN